MMPLDPEPAAPAGSKRARISEALATPERRPPTPVRAVAIAAVLTAMTLVVLDAGMTNLALPTIANALGASPALAVPVVTAYQTALLAALLPCAALGERFGCRPVFAPGAPRFIAFVPLWG